MTVSPTGIDAVLEAPPPAFSPALACDAGRTGFGLDAAGASGLGSERDQAFLLRDAAGVATGVLKVSNQAEDPAMLDMEALATFHAIRVDQELTIALPRRTVRAGREPAPPGDDAPGDDVPGRRLRWEHDGAPYWVRAYDVLPGRARLDPLTLPDGALSSWGETTARLGRALRGFIHPRAIRRLPWDVQHAATARPMLSAIDDPGARAAVTGVLDRFDAAVTPRWGELRAQVIHGDLTADNVLADEDGLITGIVDFGDMTHTALIADLASVLDSVCAGRVPEEMFRTARLVIDGYQRVLPLEQAELDLLGELWAARSAVTVAIGSWRAAAGLEDPAFAGRFHDSALAMLDALLTAGWDALPSRLGAGLDGSAGSAPQPGPAGPTLAARRGTVFGPTTEAFSYAAPIELSGVRGV
ncbi:MAG: phosphotransferase [Streptosporangiaceae bacterium]